MAKQTINVGTSPNDGTGTPLRTAFQYTNSNFSELYTAVGPSGNNIVVPGTATITGAANFNGGALAGYLNGSLMFGSSGNTVNFFAQSSGFAFKENTGANNLLTISNAGVFGFLDGAGGTRMTLNSTGLGVGGSPQAKIHGIGTGVIGLFTQGAAPGAALSAVTIQAPVASGFTSNPVLNFWFQNTGISNPANECFAIRTSSADRLYIDSAGNVGVGVTPSAWGASFKVIQLRSGSLMADSGGSTLYNVQNVYFDGSSWLRVNAAASTRYEQSAGVHTWWNAPTGTAGTAATFAQAMTLDASGDLLVGTTLKNGSWNTKLTLSNDSGTTRWAVGPYLGGVTNFLISAGAATGVYLNGTAATSWTSASDERLKDIIEPISNAVAKVGSLRAVIGKFKFDELNTRKPFLIAQDVQSVLPEAVDASNPDKLGVAYTDVIPLLVAAIKELTARVQTLEAK
jgi:hypothetical protein